MNDRGRSRPADALDLAAARGRRLWRILVGLQLLAVAVVAVAVVVIWIVGTTSDLFGHR